MRERKEYAFFPGEGAAKVLFSIDLFDFSEGFLTIPESEWAHFSNRFPHLNQAASR